MVEGKGWRASSEKTNNKGLSYEEEHMVHRGNPGLGRSGPQSLEIGGWENEW